MVLKELAVLFGIIFSAVMFVLNIRGHLRLYPDRQTSLTWTILGAEIIKTVGGTVLCLIWMASSLLLMEGATGVLGDKGSYVAIFMLFPVAVLFYFIMAGFIRLIDAFPEMIHDNNLDDE